MSNTAYSVPQEKIQTALKCVVPVRGVERLGCYLPEDLAGA
jgi:hypothetical protein